MEENHKFAAVTASCMCLLQAMRHLLRGAGSAEQQHTGHISVCCPVTAGVVRACGCRGDFGWDHFAFSSVHPSSSAENTAVMHICSHDKTSLPAASHGERENAKMSQVISLTTSAVLMLRQCLDFLKKCGWWEGRKEQVGCIYTNPGFPSGLPSQLGHQPFLHEHNEDIYSPREDTTAHLFCKWTLT